MDFLYDIDKWLFYLINVNLHNHYLFLFMGYITEFRHWKMPIIFFVAFYFLWTFFSPVIRGGSLEEGKEELINALKKGMIFIIMVGVGLGIGEYLNHNVLKPFFGRIRPCNVLDGVKILAPCNSSFSFPSSHAVNVVSLATIMAFEYRRFAPVVCAIALLVCYSRVFLGVHYPSDVVTGLLFGLSCGATVVFLKTKSFRWYTKRAQDKQISGNDSS